MAEEVGGDNTETEHSSVQISEIQASSSSEGRRRASKGVERTWASLQKRKAPRGNPSAGASAQWSSLSEAKKHCRRTSGTICESAAKELESLAAHMLNLPDSVASLLWCL